jgi:DNA topoisomerase VI subunit B
MLIEDNIKKTKFFNKNKKLVGYYGDGKKLYTLYEK